MKKFLLAPDSFKGTMNADEVCDIMEAGIRRRLPEAVVRRFPMADGGEGLVDAFLRICGGRKVTASVSGPFCGPVEADYGILPTGEAVVEMAACAGLPLVGNKLDPLNATTYGVGELLAHAKASGASKIILGLGGSATNDCGIGMAAALGYTFYGNDGKELEPIAAHLPDIVNIKPPTHPIDMEVQAACDVDNPLYGEQGATHTFGAQKGVTGKMFQYLDDGMKNMARVISHDLGISVADTPGTGAAGGLGAGVLAFLSGSLRPGIDLLLDMSGFDAALAESDIVFTGEGRIDWQSVHGKVPVGVARRARKHRVPCIALCGSIGEKAEEVYDEGINALFSSINRPGDFDSIKKTSHEDFRILVNAVLNVLLLDNDK